jgi:hypothetical protein
MQVGEQLQTVLKSVRATYDQPSSVHPHPNYFTVHTGRTKNASSTWYIPHGRQRFW